MKKLFLSMAIVFVCLTAGAQMYVGGEAYFWREWQKGLNNTTFRIAPEVGYNLNDKWAVGTYFEYQYKYDNPRTAIAAKEISNVYWIAPYARYTFAKFGPVNLFVDGVFGLATYKIKTNGVSGNAHNAWAVDLAPGLTVNLTERLSFIAKVGFLGYINNDDMDKLYSRNGFGFGVDGNSVKFGILYNF